ncbi:hypothetical protein K4K49_012468 [Colletotrichum sp. SAR 10_70]|nr:hypothetical protein K4K50_011932 [Colletotrichum sp. SAR 10_71]KAI8189598.1 hypothetical protein K4K49_012468 [Colletotrichum sp. SAR 10_70]KAI8250805.1 hypothetical protein K4K53_012448 [Colletotrichum sp. SAR 10_77]
MSKVNASNVKANQADNGYRASNGNRNDKQNSAGSNKESDLKHFIRHDFDHVKHHYGPYFGALFQDLCTANGLASKAWIDDMGETEVNE